MKNIKGIFSIVVMASVLFTACKKEIAKVDFLGGTDPVLTASNTSAQVLSNAHKDDPALTFSWTNPNYQFSTGLSSQDVTYTLQIDTAGSNFTNPNLSETSISKDLSVALTIGDLNKKLLSMNLQPGQTYNVKFRIKSSLVNAAVPLYSNVIEAAYTTYLDAAVTPPGTAPMFADGQLFLVGSASQGGWDNPVPAATQKFTRIDATHYTLTTQLNGGQEFLLLPVNGSWDAKFGNACGSNSCNNASGDSFKAQGDNFKGPATAGTYTITVNFISGKYTITQ